MSIVTTIVSAALSFCIAAYGWGFLNKRADKSAKRSETFTLISIVTSILDDFDLMAETQFKEYINDAALVGPLQSSKYKCNAQKQQMYEAKFLTRFGIFRARLLHLEGRNVVIPTANLIELKKAMTLTAINSSISYQKTLTATQKIHQELYLAFEREHC
jgi:hypothetical protein